MKKGKIENVWSGAYVDHTTAKQEKGCEMCEKKKKARVKQTKLLFFRVKYTNL